MNEIKMKASAKINLSLSVIGKRNDGYHELDTIMQSIGLFDNVSIKKSDEVTVYCDSVNCAENIAVRAAKLFFEAVSISGGAEITIQKHIPAAAGLGGGSADAAAVLVGLNRLYESGLSNKSLCSLAVKLGADVPFLICGGTARAKGIGEKLTPLKPLENCYFIIAKSEQKLSTAEMFRQLDSEAYEKPNIAATENAIDSCDFEKLTGTLENSFEILWRKSSLKNQLEELSPAATSLSGSGPARFALFKTHNEAQKALAILESKGISSYLCSPVKNSISFE